MHAEGREGGDLVPKLFGNVFVSSMFLPCESLGTRLGKSLGMRLGKSLGTRLGRQWYWRIHSLRARG